MIRPCTPLVSITALVSLFFFAIFPANASDSLPVLKLKSAAATELAFNKIGNTYGVTLASPLGSYVQAQPAQILITTSGNVTHWSNSGYSKIAQSTNSSIDCVADVTSENGSHFRVHDSYQLNADRTAFIMSRSVTVLSSNVLDLGFNSRYSLSPSEPEVMSDDDFFVPGVWYKDNAYVRPGALASIADQQYYYIREDRLPLPLVAVRNKLTNLTLTMAHIAAAPVTFAGDIGRNIIIDGRLQYGSIGIVNTSSPSPSFLFPGTEGQTTYLGRPTAGWAYRCHPVQPGVSHEYRLMLRLTTTSSFSDMLKSSWRSVARVYWPADENIDLQTIYKNQMQLLDVYTASYYGTVGVPFAVKAASGVVADTSSEMGFVGKALPAAALLLRNGIDTNNSDEISRATEVFDFWVHKCVTPSGVMRTWYDVHPDGSITWRDYHAFFRNTVDGAEAALTAYELMRRANTAKPDWLKFSEQFGDWLITHQGADGSWAREYDLNGVAVNPAKDTTIQAVPILVDLYKATGDSRYMNAALEAGSYCLSTIYNNYQYEGGTADNPNIMDKESGMMALTGFLALEDLAPSQKWIDAAVQAADFSETWTYLWNIPMPDGDPNSLFPQNRKTWGMSLIATGHSGADTYMADAPFMFYRLYLLTGDRHYAQFADFTLHDTRMLQDYDGALGYKYRGLQTEAMTLSSPRGHGVTTWLPWLATTQLEPLVQLKDVFGTMEIRNIEELPLQMQQKLLSNYSKSHGYSLVSK